MKSITWKVAGGAALLVVVSVVPACSPVAAVENGEAPAMSASLPAFPPSPTSQSGQIAAAPSTTVTTEENVRPDLEPLAELGRLPIKGRAPKTGYSRDLFGDAWTDDVAVAGGHNGCDTRNDILRRDLVEVEIKPGSSDCVVLSGTLHDPYSGNAVAFRRGSKTSSDVQVDHLVALSDSWQKGAQAWDKSTRRNFANDPMNLQATIGELNQQKRDGDAATWLPPDNSYRCTYVARIVRVKAAYGLWITQGEHDAIARILSNCDIREGTLPAHAAPADLQPSVSLAPGPSSESAPMPPTTNPDDTPAAYFPNCRVAREAGAAPLYAGQPGYRTGLDGDDDGIACEN